MVGRERDADYYHEGRQRTVDRRVAGLRRRRAEPARRLSATSSFDVRAGEILGIGGLLESGKSMLGKVLAGVVRADAGRSAARASSRRPPEHRSA